MFALLAGAAGFSRAGYFAHFAGYLALYKAKPAGERDSSYFSSHFEVVSVGRGALSEAELASLERDGKMQELLATGSAKDDGETGTRHEVDSLQLLAK